MSDKYHKYVSAFDKMNNEDIIAKYNKDKEEILSNIKNDINGLIQKWGKINSPFQCDINCKFNLVKQRRTAFKCVQCKYLMRMYAEAFDLDKVNELYINTKDKISTKMLIYEDPRFTLDRRPAPLKDMEEKYIITGDNFSLDLLSTLIMEDIFKEYHLKNSINNITAFICGKNGFILNQYYPTDLNYIYGKCNNSQTTMQLLKQLCIIFKLLSKEKIVFNNFDILSFADIPCSFIYDERQVTAPFTVVVNNYRDASFSHAGHRFLNNYYIKYFNHFSHLDFDTKISFLGEDAIKYHMKDKKTFDRNRNLGLNYNISLDFYYLLFTLYKNENFRNSIDDNELLAALWKDIWSNVDDMGELDYQYQYGVYMLEDIYIKMDLPEYIFDRLT